MIARRKGRWKVEIPVYADVLMAVNFLIDYLLLLFCARLSGRRILRKRLLSGALVGAFASLVIFLPPLPFWPMTLLKAGTAVLMVRIAYPWLGWWGLVRDGFLFFTVSFLLAGICLGLWLGLGTAGVICYNGVTYFDVSLGTLLASMTAAYLVLTLYARFRALPSGEHFTAVLTRNGKSLRLPALRDSGNRLTEPFSGDPAAVADLHAVQGLLTAEEIAAVLQAGQGSSFSSDPRLRLVPCRTACGAGAMLAFRPDQLLLEGEEGCQTVEEIWIAVTADPMGSGEFSLLLPAVFSGLPIKEGTKCLQALQS